MNNEEDSQIEVQFKILERKLQDFEIHLVSIEECDIQLKYVKKLIQNDSVFIRKKRLMNLEAKHYAIILKLEREDWIQKLIFNTNSLLTIIQQIKSHHKNWVELTRQGHQIRDEIVRKYNLLQDNNETCSKTQKIMKDSLFVVEQFQKEVETFGQDKQSSISIHTLRDSSFYTPKMMREQQLSQMSNFDLLYESDHKTSYAQNCLIDIQEVPRLTSSQSNNNSVYNKIKQIRDSTSFWSKHFSCLALCNFCDKNDGYSQSSRSIIKRQQNQKQP